ncbi:MAG: hypothetical protein HYY06_23955, partial [Deltaproteobacteria bacterium]|nr:hypothetical protein [Deltaproteobacteria bacterium]
MRGAEGTGRPGVGPWVVSFLAHAGLALGLWWTSGGLPGLRHVAPPIELDVGIAAPRPSRAPVPRANVEPVPSTASAPPAPRHAVAPRRLATAPRSLPGPQPTSEPVSEPPRCPSDAPPSAAVSLDPRSVALRAVLGEAPRVDEEPAHDGGDRARSSDLDDSLRAFADRGRAELSTRPPPVLVPTTDGGYDYEGSGASPLSARIAPDGRLSFRVRGRVDPEPGVATDLATGRAWPTIQFRPNVDLNDAVAAMAGEDPLAPEKAWIARETEGLRERLADRARAVEAEAALISLGDRLEAIAGDDRLGAARRRELVFEIWDDCATDAIGGRARRVVEAFIRERFPEGTALAYT